MRIPLLIAAALLPALAFAQGSGQDSGQKPPQSQAKPDAPKCVTESSTFRQHRGSPAAVIELTNACEQRQRCKINAHVTTAFGARTGERMTILAAKSKGAAAKKIWAIPVKQAAGNIDLTYNCKPF